MQHDSIGNEKVALVWHRLGEVISIVAAVAGLGIFFTSAVGAAWHSWAIKQHKERITELKEKK